MGSTLAKAAGGNVSDEDDVRRMVVPDGGDRLDAMKGDLGMGKDVDHADDGVFFKQVEELAGETRGDECGDAMEEESLGTRGLVGEHNAMDIENVLADDFDNRFVTKQDMYVPYDLAQASVINVAKTLSQVTDASLISLAEVEDSFKKFTSKTRGRYDAALWELREKSRVCIDGYKTVLERVREKQKQREADWSSKEALLKTQLESNEIEKKTLLENKDMELKVRLENKEAELKAMLVSKEVELQAIKENVKKNAKVDGKSKNITAHVSVQAQVEDQVENSPVPANVSALPVDVNVLALARQARTQAVIEACATLQDISKVAANDPEFLANYVGLMEKLADMRAAHVQEENKLAARKTQAEAFELQGESVPEVLLADILASREMVTELEKKIEKRNEQVANLVKVRAADKAARQREGSKPDEGGLKIAAEEKQKVNNDDKVPIIQDLVGESSFANIDKGEMVYTPAELVPSESESSGGKLNDVESLQSQVIVQQESVAQNEFKVANAEPKEAGEGSNPTPSSDTRVVELEAEVTRLQSKLSSAITNDEKKERGMSKSSSPSFPASSSAAAQRYAEKLKVAEAKLKESEKQMREARVKANKFEKQVQALENTASSGTGSGSSSSKDTIALRKELESLKKAEKNRFGEAEKAHQKAMRDMQQELKAMQSETSTLRQTVADSNKERKILHEAASRTAALEAENASLEQHKTTSFELKKKVETLSADCVELETLYTGEQALRKKYYNIIEDMKGKIRVFARCRPMAAYEKERQCLQVTQFPEDGMTLNVEVGGGKEKKQFVYDHVFGPESTQEEIFQDTSNLVQSSLDGYNVCVFAYGQTGSGKTWTMVGSPTMPGIVRRSVSSVYAHKRENAGKKELTVRLYMMELYLDNLVDLLYKVCKKSDHGSVPKEMPKLDIKKDKSGTVFVKGAQIVTVNTEEEMLEFFDRANAVRKVGSTKMNAGSSRSHLIFSVVLENTDLATKKTTVGKLSLVDLAGSERQDKTEAQGDQLKEAMSINKSLSALGDVISALSSGESFIPYRNNKLTQLMSDSLGGNAKTLMFVNISPADYNVEETISSLTYAQRVKLITNNAGKSEQSDQVTLLKKIVKELKEGNVDLYNQHADDLF